jgi:hypothetical protein
MKPGFACRNLGVWGLGLMGALSWASLGGQARR